MKYRGVKKNQNSSFNLYSHLKWVACISVKGKTRHLLYTDDPEHAAREYDRWAKYYHGKKAKLNFPND